MTTGGSILLAKGGSILVAIDNAGASTNECVIADLRSGRQNAIAAKGSALGLGRVEQSRPYPPNLCDALVEWCGSWVDVERSPTTEDPLFF